MSAAAGPKLAPYTLVWKHEAAEDVWDICLETAGELVQGLKPGMFVNVAVPGDPSHILRIPLSFYRTDPVRGWICMIVAAVGEGTRRLCSLEPGEGSTLLAPLGHGWRMPQEGAKRALLVAGGVGAPPVFAAARMLQARGIDCDVVMGAKSERFLWKEGAQALSGNDGGAGYESALSRGGFCEVFLATDDGSYGYHGFTTGLAEELVGKHGYDVVMTCGPQPMMAGVAKVAAAAHIPCQVSMERMMTCGFGACNTCSVQMADGTVRACCQDGPVFDAEEVLWK